MESVILIKPDAIVDQKQDEIINIITDRNIKINSQNSIQLMRDDLIKFYKIDISSILGHERFDHLVHIFSKEITLVLLVEGEDIYEEGLKIKKHIREVYKKDYMGAYVHTSDNEEEYLREFQILNEKMKKTTSQFLETLLSI